MPTREAIKDFLAQKTLALAGASRTKEKYGNKVFRNLTRKGYTIYLIHPAVAEIEGVPCYRSLADLPAAPGGLILVVPPAQTEKLVRQAAAAGIKRIWMQPGAESPAAIQFCAENGIAAVHDECIMLQS